MKTYHLQCAVTVTATCEVRAKSLEEALKLADSLPVVIGGVGSGYLANEAWSIEEADGAPQNIEESK